jgi:hypothetical protein
MHVPVWVEQGWYTKHRGCEEWRKRRWCNKSNPVLLRLEKICTRGDENTGSTELQDL